MYVQLQAAAQILIRSRRWAARRAPDSKKMMKCFQVRRDLASSTSMLIGIRKGTSNRLTRGTWTQELGSPGSTGMTVRTTTERQEPGIVRVDRRGAGGREIRPTHRIGNSRVAQRTAKCRTTDPTRRDCTAHPCFCRTRRNCMKSCRLASEQAWQWPSPVQA